MWSAIKARLRALLCPNAIGGAAGGLELAAGAELVPGCLFGA